jgi:uncharacterized protein YjbI with pentapeptide repeats
VDRHFLISLPYHLIVASPDPDHYTLLSVSRTATFVEIRAAYRRLAREHHPDTNPDPAAEALMRRINDAWETLRDPGRRSLYDRQLPHAAPVRPVRRQPPPRRQADRRTEPSWFAAEEAPREPARATAEYTGDITVNWYREIGVREDAPRHEILKALSRMAESLSGADIAATEFARRRKVMKDAWAVLGDQYLRAAYDRARRNPPPPGDNPKSKIQNPNSSPPPSPGHRVGPVTHNGYIVDKGANLAGRDLRGADLRGLDLADINLSGARLQGAELESASLRRANLTGAELSGANLRFADLSHADASGATFRQADLHGAALAATKFFRANLAGASLTEAVGPGVNLDYADLARADFTGARITPQLIERGRLDHTLMPDGTAAGAAV